MNLSFETCTVNHLDVLCEISRSTFVTAFEKDNDPEYFWDYINSAFNPETILEEIQNKNSTFYFILSNKTIVGYFKLNQEDAQNELFTKPSIELERIYVLPDFQGQGIGKIALFKIIKLAQEKKVDFLWLGVWQENKSAITFYQKNGFKIFGSHPYFIGKDKQTDWLMKYQLD